MTLQTKQARARAIADGVEAKRVAAEAPSVSEEVAALIGLVDQAYEVVAIDSIRPHPKNNNEGDIEAIRGSMQENDFYGACIVQRSSGYIVAGNHRWLVGKDEGLTEIPVIFIDVDNKQALRILVADNATARRAKVNAEATYRIVKALGVLKDPSKAAGLGLSPSDVLALQAVYDMDLEAEDDPAPKPGGVPAGEYGLNVICNDEGHQEEIYEMLTEMGLDVKVYVT